MHQNQKDAETALGLLRVLQLYNARGAENGVLESDVALVCAELRLARQEGRSEKEAEQLPITREQLRANADANWNAGYLACKNGEQQHSPYRGDK